MRFRVLLGKGWKRTGQQPGQVKRCGAAVGQVYSTSMPDPPPTAREDLRDLVLTGARTRGVG
jgi:hypothetical protein